MWAAIWLNDKFRRMITKLSVVGCPMIGDLNAEVAGLKRTLAATESEASEAAQLARSAQGQVAAIVGERDEAKILHDLPPLPEREMFGVAR